jgi:hypothetical protein
MRASHGLREQQSNRKKSQNYNKMKGSPQSAAGAFELKHVQGYGDE